MKEKLSSFLLLEGFVPATKDGGDFEIYLKKETGFVTVLMVYLLRPEVTFTGETYHALKNRAMELLSGHNLPEMHTLFLVMTERVGDALEATAGDRNAWVMDLAGSSMVIPEDRVEDFYGMKGMFVRFLSNPGGAERVLNEVRKEIDTALEKQQKIQKKKNLKAIPWVSIGIAVLCLQMGIMSYLFGDPFTDLFSLDPVAIFEKHQWYRLITYMYVHADLSHYVNNMVMLYMEGTSLENAFGRWRYVLLYHLLGMIAGLGSLAYKIYIGSDVPSIGASGAIMAFLGVIVYLTIRNIRSFRGGSLYRVFIMVLLAFYSVYEGFKTPGVDNAAHVAGMAAGIIAGIAWDLILRYKRRTKKNS